MGEIVNLRRRRKEMARAEKERLAEENRYRYGRTRAQREADRLAKTLQSAGLDGHRRAAPDEEEA